MKQPSYADGFTLIELMIAMAIVGILAAFAVPAYQDYVVKAKLTEPFVILSGKKAAILDHFSSKGIMPAANSPLVNTLYAELSNSTVVLKTLPASTSGDNSKLNVGFEVKNLGASTGSPSKNTVAFQYQGSETGIKIACTASIGTTLESKYLPPACR
ncbi:Fimbrial protein precursor [Marinobacter litoralis]|uniref:Pilin n=1 Tax=Marinobacter litoralis TaxID=187981 RepID=A0A3M2RF59_9GAMM|nr:pilin [Marinobacter litoralis]RMJ03951.1 Fimbrial protein precursor [Marinobacter litoralis]